jgi:hypothetical protein
VEENFIVLVCGRKLTPFLRLKAINVWPGQFASVNTKYTVL